MSSDPKELRTNLNGWWEQPNRPYRLENPDGTLFKNFTSVDKLTAWLKAHGYRDEPFPNETTEEQQP